MIQRTNTLAQGIDKAPKDRYPSASWLRCPDKSCMWERSIQECYLLGLGPPDVVEAGRNGMPDRPTGPEQAPTRKGV